MEKLGGGSCSSSETETLQEEERSRKRAQKEQADKKCAEEERVANLPLMAVNFISRQTPNSSSMRTRL